jgi:hypothetical protein
MHVSKCLFEVLLDVFVGVLTAAHQACGALREQPLE